MQYQRQWIIPHWTGHYVIGINPLGTATESQRQATRRALFVLLREFRSGDLQTRRVLREIQQALSPLARSPFHGLDRHSDSGDEARVAEVVERAATMGQLTIVPDERPLMLSLRAPEVLEPLPEDAVKEEPPTLHFVEIELRDEDDVPVAGEAYRLKLPDGRELTGWLDSNGRASVPDIKTPGNCQVSFPNLDASMW